MPWGQTPGHRVTRGQTPLPIIFAAVDPTWTRSSKGQDAGLRPATRARIETVKQYLLSIYQPGWPSRRPATTLPIAVRPFQRANCNHGRDGLRSE